MKKYLILSLLLAFAIISCNKNNNTENKDECPDITFPYPKTGSICNSTECVQYQAIWKELFIAKSNLTEDFFNRHIKPYNTKIVKSTAHEYFYVYYDVTVDWVTTNSVDSFMVKTNGMEFPQIQLPVDQYLNKEQIQAFISQYHYINKINPITKQEKLIYTSMEDAKSKLKAASTNLICPISFLLGPSDGHIMLKAETSFTNGPVVETFIYFTKSEGH